jgi:Zn-finger nucleic acid-binding protein
VKCPTDDTILQLAERQGIEIDYCPLCRGVWLDRGELDKIIERAEVAGSAPPRVDERSASRERERDRDRDWDDDDHRRNSDRYPKKRKRGGFLGELFEFGD